MNNQDKKDIPEQEDERGIPYSVSEARGAAREHKDMDIYHKELMLFLCDRVEELEQKIQKSNTPEESVEKLEEEWFDSLLKVPRDRILKLTPTTMLKWKDETLYQWWESEPIDELPTQQRIPKGCWVAVEKIKDTKSSKNHKQPTRGLSVWMIEPEDPEHPGCHIPDVAMTIRKNGIAAWGPYTEAIKFVCKSDAESVARVVLPLRKTLVAEHIWF